MQKRIIATHWKLFKKRNDKDTVLAQDSATTENSKEDEVVQPAFEASLDRARLETQNVVSAFLLEPLQALMLPRVQSFGSQNT